MAPQVNEAEMEHLPGRVLAKLQLVRNKDRSG